MSQDIIWDSTRDISAYRACATASFNGHAGVPNRDRGLIYSLRLHLYPYLLSCQPKVTVTSCCVYKDIRDL